MAGVDVSSYPTAASMAAQQQANNPLTTLSGLADLRSRSLQNQLVARTMASQQAIGQHLQDATNPDGNIDYRAAMAASAKDPNAAFGMQEAAANANAQMQQQYELGMRHYGMVHQVMGALAEKPDLTIKDFASVGGDLLTMDPSFTPKMIATEITHIAALNPTNDPQKFRQIAGQYRDEALTAQQQVEAHYRPTPINTGGQTQFVNTAPEAPMPGPLTNTASPESMNQPVTTFDPKAGAPMSQPMSSYLQATKGGPVQAGPAQGTDTAANANANANAQRYQSALVAANEAHNTKSLLGNMSGDLTQFQTGPGADSWKAMIARANYWTSPKDRVDENAVASQENFTKVARILANHTMEAGGGTDMAKAFSMAQNPNTEVSTEGNRRIIAGLQGQADRDILKGSEAINYAKAHPNDPNAYSDYENKFNRSFDLRMFQAQYLSPKALAEMKAGMSDAEWKSFKGRYEQAIDRGYVRAPQR